MIQQNASGVAKAISNPLKLRISSPNTSPDDELTRNGGKRQQKATTRISRNMQDHQKESKRGHQEIQPRDHTRNDHGIKEREERRTQKLGQDRLITLLDKQVREIHDQDMIIECIEEFYTEL